MTLYNCKNNMKWGCLFKPREDRHLMVLDYTDKVDTVTDIIDLANVWEAMTPKAHINLERAFVQWHLACYVIGETDNVFNCPSSIIV